MIIMNEASSECHRLHEQFIRNTFVGESTTVDDKYFWFFQSFLNSNTHYKIELLTFSFMSFLFYFNYIFFRFILIVLFLFIIIIF